MGFGGRSPTRAEISAAKADVAVATHTWSGDTCDTCGIDNVDFETVDTPTCMEWLQMRAYNERVKRYGYQADTPADPEPEPTKPRRGPQAAREARIGAARAKAMATAVNLGLPIPERPTDERGQTLEPEMPADITALSLDQLGRLYGQFSAMAGYAAAQVALSEVDTHEAKSRLGYIEATMGLQSEGKNAQERRWAIEVSDPYVQAEQTWLTCKATTTLLQQLLERYKDGRATLSRELTRRGVDIDNRQP
jgi:hypothetical protein